MGGSGLVLPRFPRSYRPISNYISSGFSRFFVLGGFSPFCVGEQSARVSLLVIPCVFLAFPCISCLSGVFAFLCVLGVSLALRFLCLWEVVCLSL